MFSPFYFHERHDVLQKPSHFIEVKTYEPCHKSMFDAEIRQNLVEVCHKKSVVRVAKLRSMPREKRLHPTKLLNIFSP